MSEQPSKQIASLYTRDGETLVEIRDPHSQFRAVGAFVTYAGRKLGGVEIASLWGTDMKFVLKWDGPQAYVVGSEALVRCDKCNRFLKERFNPFTCYGCLSAKEQPHA